jgi:hypothetical protein
MLNLRRRLAFKYANLRSWYFDVHHRVETREFAQLDELTLLGDHVKDAVHYEPVYPEEMSESLRQLRIEFPEYTFIDVGSGKGRALLIAANYPFRRIIGIEFAAELHERAARNILSYRCSTRRCFDVTSVHADAMEFAFPVEPLVLYFNNPFREHVMEGVMCNLERSLRESPRPAYILAYCRWTATGVIERVAGIRLLVRGSFYSIYEIPPYSQLCERG